MPAISRILKKWGGRAQGAPPPPHPGGEIFVTAKFADKSEKRNWKTACLTSGLTAVSQKRRPGLAHLCVGEAVLVGIVEVFAAHAPDKHVIACACRAMDAPFG